MLGIPGVEYPKGASYVGADKRYYRAGGTSFAAPIVAGVASLLIANDPTLGPDDVKRILVQSARDIDAPGVDQFSGYGLLDARAALTMLAAAKTFFIESAITGVSVVQAGGKPRVRVTGTADADALKSAWIEIGAGESPTEWKKVSAALLQPVRGGTLADIDAETLRSSARWTLRLVTEHRDGRRREARFLLSLG